RRLPRWATRGASRAPLLWRVIWVETHLLRPVRTPSWAQNSFPHSRSVAHGPDYASLKSLGSPGCATSSGKAQAATLPPGCSGRAMVIPHAADRATESFRGLLLRHRGRTGLTQRELATRVGASRRAVQDWEAGAQSSERRAAATAHPGVARRGR